MRINAKYGEWCENNPEKWPWLYDGAIVPKAKIKRLGLMIRQEMINYEKSGGYI